MLSSYYKSFTLYRRTDSDFSGATYASVGTYKGFIQPVGGGETFREGKGGEAATHRLYTGLSTPAVYGDRVTYKGQNYKVIYAIQPQGISSVEHHKEILLGLFE